ncbi:MAG: HAD family hydrolase [Chloroflexi bacterium]|nr:HAD family hydrolase [Chloroflexota bacterium]
MTDTLETTQTLKAVLFDLDDTLLDWSDEQTDWLAYEQQFLQRVFDYICQEVHPLPDMQAFIDEFHRLTREGWSAGRSTFIAPHLGRILVQAAEASGAPTGCLDDRRCLEVYGWKAVPGCRLFPEVPAVLSLLRDSGIKVGIVTNAYQPMWMRDVEIEQHGLLEYFPDCRISAADVGYLKPHPAIFRAALKVLDIQPEEAVFVGDNPTADIAGAQAAGLRGILRVTQSMQPMLSGLIVPDAAINSLEELPRILDEWYPGWRV